MTGKQEITIGLLIALRFFSCIFFVIGVIMNYDGYEILRNQGNYKSGLLKFDSLYHTSADEFGTSNMGFWGHVDFIRTGLNIGDTESPEVKEFLRKVSHGEEILTPVWYRRDGQLTLDRYPHEKTFPIGRIWQKVIMYSLFLNCPFIALCVIIWRLKRKYKTISKIRSQNV